MAQLPISLRTPIFHNLWATELIDPQMIGIAIERTPEGIKLIDPVDNAAFSLQKTGTFRIGSYGISWKGMDTQGRKWMLQDLFACMYRLAVENAKACSHKPLADCEEDLIRVHRLPTNPHLTLTKLPHGRDGQVFEIRPTDPHANWAVGIFEAPMFFDAALPTPETILDAVAFEQPTHP